MSAPSAKQATHVAVLGSTGTIGINTLDVIRRHPQRYKVAALTAHRNLVRLYQQCLEFKPQYAVMNDVQTAAELQQRLYAAGLATEVLTGAAGLEQVAALSDVDCVMAAIVGAAGLLPTLAAVRAGKRVLLANKEALVMAGQLFMQAVQEGHAQLLPIDSEHNAVFQCMSHGLEPDGAQCGLGRAGAVRIVLTASGGPFRDLPLSTLQDVTPAQACAHPNWVMGRKISVDSATMMNKGLEIIEASWLFSCRPDQIEVLLHPQSVVHSMVVFTDGSVLAQLGNPDMRTPIAHALAWPERITSGVRALDLVEVARLEFCKLDPARYPCLCLAFDALRAGGTSTTILNAANEVAVENFLDEQIGFTDIPRVIEHTLESVAATDAVSLGVILAADRAARIAAGEYIAALTH
ncbi:MAG: 1-deoxy-D-xylulose-5-phosphate reductoisomerase [Pseudomonadota bacterium]|nr:1-deoxy-D-xylulose-5-phosphate reductoisomerase [Pseudomonadota bacterium]